MILSETLHREQIFCDIPGSSKKRVLENASELIAKSVSSLDAEEIFSGLINRERLGSTGLGDGVAIPHCRLSSCVKILGALIRLPKALDFDAIYRQPVDLIFLLFVPEKATDEHLQTLAGLAECLSQAEYREGLRSAANADELYQRAVECDLVT